MPRQPDDESPEHTVTIRGPFLMSATEVTHNQYLKVVWVEPAGFGRRPPRRWLKAGEHPAEFVSYHDVLEYCRCLAGEGTREEGAVRSRGMGPTDCRRKLNGSIAVGPAQQTPFSFGDKLSNIDHAQYAPKGDDKEMPLEGDTRPELNIDRIPGPVARFKPNDWGFIRLMHGNVAEWCLDWYSAATPAANRARTRPGQRPANAASLAAVPSRIPPRHAAPRRERFTIPATAGPRSASAWCMLRSPSGTPLPEPGRDAVARSAESVNSHCVLISIRV